MSMIKQTEVHVIPTGKDLPKQVVFHNTWAGNSIAGLAIDLIKHRMMSPTPQSPEALVDHCIQIADLTYKKFEQKGWLIEMPSWQELNDGAPGPIGFRAE